MEEKDKGEAGELDTQEATGGQSGRFYSGNNLVCC